MAQVIGTPAESMKDKPVVVRLSKLTEGIGIVFSGVLTMLEALDAASAQKLIDTLKLEDGGDASVNPAANGTGEEKLGEGAPSGGVDAMKTAETAGLANAVSPNAAGRVKAETSAEQEEAAAPIKSAGTTVPTVTQDDITKIIVQKIKKNRSNNEKIGAVLKTYGVAKVSELPPARYEAFLTDISQI